ncbi:MAG: major facilitator superfamily 1 [Verrucomicrobia bacterium]|nr:major facilitator superfamily 1 [Verrucomicrobiota bacterium]
MPRSTVTRRLAWAAVALLWVVALLNYLDRLVITTMREPIIADIPMTEAQFGLLTSVFLWVYGLASPFCGFLADRYSRRGVIFASLLIWSVVTWLTGQMHSYSGLFWARALMGVSEACYLPAALALISDHHRGSTRSLATALHGSGMYAGGALGGLGGFIAEAYGWRAGFTLLGAVGVGYALVLVIFLRDAPRGDETASLVEPVRGGASLRELFSRGSFSVLLLLNALVGVANWAVYGWLPTYLREHFKLGLGSAGLSATAYLQVASFGGILAGGALADQWSRRRPRGRMLVPAIGYLAAAPALFVLGWSDTLAVALGGLVLFGIGRGFYDANLMPILRTLVDERYSATGYGFLNMIGCLAGGGMTYVSGVLRDRQVSLAIVFQCAAAGLLVTSLLLFALKPRAAGPSELLAANER